MYNFSCAIIRDDEMFFYHEKGIADLYKVLHETPQILEGAKVLDRIVGKGAATLMVAGKIAKLQTPVISEPAFKLLQNAGIEVEYDEKVPYIINRRGDGMCPLEQRCKDTDDITQLLSIIDGFITDMRKSKFVNR